MKPLNVGVIGVGYLGQHHARIYAQLPQTRLVGVAERDETRAADVTRRFGVTTCSDYRDLLGQVDAVSVAVPTLSHHEIVRGCLDAGVHVLVEKPIASMVTEGQQMVRDARRKGLTLHVGHVERFNPVRDGIRRLIQNPRFIECHRLAPFQSRGTDVDVVLDLMIHDIDLVLSFDLGRVKTVEATGVSVLSSRVDFANARITFSEGCVVNLTASRVSTGRLRKMRLFQENLYLSVDYQSRRGIVYRQTGLPTAEPSVIEESIQAGDEEPLRRELEAFVESIQRGVSLGVSGEEGVAALELAHAILDSIRGATHPLAAASNVGAPVA